MNSKIIALIRFSQRLCRYWNAVDHIDNLNMLHEYMWRILAVETYITATKKKRKEEKKLKFLISQSFDEYSIDTEGTIFDILNICHFTRISMHLQFQTVLWNNFPLWSLIAELKR